MLMATSNQSTFKYLNNSFSTIDITMDDCCLQQQDYLQQEEMEPIKLSNLNLDDLSHAKYKLEQFDEELERSLNESFRQYGTKWYNVLLGILAIFLMILFPC